MTMSWDVDSEQPRGRRELGGHTNAFCNGASLCTFDAAA